MRISNLTYCPVCLSLFIRQLITSCNDNYMLLYTFVLTNYLTTMTKLRITAYLN